MPSVTSGTPSIDRRGRNLLGDAGLPNAFQDKKLAWRRFRTNRVATQSPVLVTIDVARWQPVDAGDLVLPDRRRPPAPTLSRSAHR